MQVVWPAGAHATVSPARSQNGKFAFGPRPCRRRLAKYSGISYARNKVHEHCGSEKGAHIITAPTSATATETADRGTRGISRPAACARLSANLKSSYYTLNPLNRNHKIIACRIPCLMQELLPQHRARMSATLPMALPSHSRSYKAGTVGSPVAPAPCAHTPHPGRPWQALPPPACTLSEGCAQPKPCRAPLTTSAVNMPAGTHAPHRMNPEPTQTNPGPATHPQQPPRWARPPVHT